MNIPDELRYSTDHEWVRVDGDEVTIGITDYAQDSLGDVVFVDIPAIGAALASGESLTEVESTKSVSEIYAPVTGTISRVNGNLESEPELLNSDPYGTGWICSITMSDPAELDELLDAAAYRTLTEG